jgi:anoctamin-10
MALLNNIVEFRSDAFKIVTHFRRALPMRTDTIGPWLNCLSFLTWLSALTNSALVWLFHDQLSVPSTTDMARPPTCALISRALFIAFAASHGYIVLRVAVRHLLERVMWIGSAEKKRMDTTAREVRKQYLQSISQGTRGLGPLDPAAAASTASTATDNATDNAAAAAITEAQGQISPLLPPSAFWEFDEGLAEIRKGIKDD